MSRRMRCLSGAGGCARMGDHGEAGWGLAYGYSFARLLDVNTQVIKARRDGGLACMSRRIRNCSLDLLKVKARAITANKMGALAYLARSMLALLHIVPSAYMRSSFSLC